MTSKNEHNQNLILKIFQERLRPNFDLKKNDYDSWDDYQLYTRYSAFDSTQQISWAEI